MTNRLHDTPNTEKRKSHSDWVDTQCKREVDEERESAKSPIVSDIGCPNDSAVSSQYNGESLDFGDSSVDFI